MGVRRRRNKYRWVVGDGCEASNALNLKPYERVGSGSSARKIHFLGADGKLALFPREQGSFPNRGSDRTTGTRTRVWARRRGFDPSLILKMRRLPSGFSAFFFLFCLGGGRQIREWRGCWRGLTRAGRDAGRTFLSDLMHDVTPWCRLFPVE